MLYIGILEMGISIICQIVSLIHLTLSMLKLLSTKANGCKDFQNISKHCQVDIHWIALTEYSQMSTHVPRIQSFSRLFASFVLAKLVA